MVSTWSWSHRTRGLGTAPGCSGLSCWCSVAPLPSRPFPSHPTLLFASPHHITGPVVKNHVVFCSPRLKAAGLPLAVCNGGRRRPLGGVACPLPRRSRASRTRVPVAQPHPCCGGRHGRRLLHDGAAPAPLHGRPTQGCGFDERRGEAPVHCQWHRPGVWDALRRAVGGCLWRCRPGPARGAGDEDRSQDLAGAA